MARAARTPHRDIEPWWVYFVLGCPVSRVAWSRQRRAARRARESAVLLEPAQLRRSISRQASSRAARRAPTTSGGARQTTPLEAHALGSAVAVCRGACLGADLDLGETRPISALASTPGPPRLKGPGCPGEGAGSPARRRMIDDGHRKEGVPVGGRVDDGGDASAGAQRPPHAGERPLLDRGSR